jgi:hypothetical protein
MFAAYGLGAGLCVGLCFAVWIELRDKSIRDEGDVLAALELPMLVSLPWSKDTDDDSKQMLTSRGPLTLLLEKKKTRFFGKKDFFHTAAEPMASG